MTASKKKRNSAAAPYRHLSNEEEAKVLAEMDHTNDRAAAVVGGGFLENALAIAISGRLRDLDSDGKMAVFGHESAPLSTFHAKIQMGYALNLFAKPILEDLRAIKRIRNLFAHRLEVSRFDHPDVVHEVQSLNYPKWRAAETGKLVENHRRQFEETVAHLVGRFTFEHMLSSPPAEPQGPTYDAWQLPLPDKPSQP